MGSRLTRGLSSELGREQQKEETNRPPERRDPNPLAEVQESAGNSAVASLVANTPESEGQADRIADATVGKLGPAAAQSPLSGSALAPGLRTALASVAPQIGSLGSVRVDSGAGAQTMTDRLGARAATAGQTISVGRGELGRGVESSRLVAHEAAHAGLHSAGAPAGMVHAKLRGTREATESQGGGKSTKGLRKLVGFKTNWDKILEGLGAYEALEEALSGGGSPSPQALAAAKPKMLAALARVELACVAWQEANSQGSREEETESHRTELVRQGPTATLGEETETDYRSKAGRRQTVSMLLPRIRREMADLGSGDWSKTLGLSERSLRSVGEKDKGQMGEVTRVTHETESGEFSGFFKPETGWLQGSKTAGRDLESGIHFADPNFGARAMAMYRLDQLLGAGVTTRVEFAVHEGKFGVVSERAKGTKARDMNWTAGQGSSGAPSVDDAMLQRCLNRLQILDSIALQLDRHTGNYFVETNDSGQVMGVTGIDLDMAFGGEYTDLSKNPRSWSHFAYRGLPEAIDEEFGQRIVQVSDDQVRQALEGLLSPQEVEATIARFQFVKDRIKVAERSGLMRKDWGQQTQGVSKHDDVEDLLEQGQKGAPTYTEVVRGKGIENSLGELIPRARLALRQELGEIPEKTREVYEALLIGNPNMRGYNKRGALYDLAAKAIADRTLTVDQAEQAFDELFRPLLSNQMLRAEIEVAVQEGRLKDGNQEWLGLEQRLTTLLKTVWPDVTARFQQRQPVNT